MKQFLPLLALLLPTVSLAAAPAPAAAPAVSAAEPLADKLLAALRGIEDAQSSDCFAAAGLVLQETGEPTRFRPLMEEAARQGSAAAIVWLAPFDMVQLQVEGADLQGDPRAVELRRRVFAVADSKSYHPALVLASRLAGLGIGAAADEALALRYLMEGSKLGDARARAAYLLVSGRLQKGGVKAPEVASELKRRNYPLEELIARSYGDTPEGASWLRRATEHGSAQAPYLLSQSRAAGLSSAEALRHLELAAERHDPEAMSFLGTLKLRAKELSAQTGVALEEDIDGGRKLLQLAAALGQAEAAQTLATFCAQGLAGTPDAEQIYRLYSLAAAQGEPHGMAGQGYCLLAGRGCTANAARGEALLRRGIDKGAQWGNQALASAYFNGFGVKPDLRRAVDALGEDAAMGSIHAYAIMAGITALGNEGTAPDPLRARIFLDMAKREGDAGAQAVYDAILAAGGWKFLPALW